MTWLPVTRTAADERAAVLGLHPEACARHSEFLEACDAAFDADLLALCKARMALYFHCREELARHSEERLARLRSWEQDDSLSPLQRRALAFVDQFILDPALIGEDLVAALERELGTAGVINFAAVIAAFEASLRLSALLDLEPAP
jgi:hypothetical protein